MNTSLLKQANNSTKPNIGKKVLNPVKAPGAVGLLLLLSSSLAFTPVKTMGAEPRAFQTARYETMEYQIFQPKDLKEEDRLPLIVGLHGAGKRQSDISKVLMPFHLVATRPEFQAHYPCYVLAPKTTKSWFPKEITVPELSAEQVAELPDHYKNQYGELSKQVNTPPEGGFGDLEILFALIDKVVTEHEIDPTRIYVVGFSMGGTGTWQAIAARPRFFAAAIPVAGGRLFPWQWNEAVFSTPVWAFQGTQDKTTVTARHRATFDYAKTIGGNMKYTEFEGAGHEIVAFAFTPTGEIQFDGRYETFFAADASDEEENVWQWLFSKRLGGSN